MRILVTNWLDRENPRAGGSETHLHEVFGRLVQRGHRVTVLSSGWPGAPARAEADGFEVRRVGGRHTFPAAALCHLVGPLQRARAYDVVVENLNKVPLGIPRWAMPPTCLLVHHLFGRAAFRSAPWPIALPTIALEGCIGVLYATTPMLAVSESTAADLVAHGIAPDQVSVVHNGVAESLLRERVRGGSFGSRRQILFSQY